MIDSATKATTAKPPGPPKRDVTEALRASAERSFAQLKEVAEKMSAGTTEAAVLVKNSFSTAVKGAQDYNSKIVEFAHTNSEAAFDFAQKLANVRTPSDFIELSTEHSRKRFEALTEQTKELAALAQEVTLATAEPFNTGVIKPKSD